MLLAWQPIERPPAGTTHDANIMHLYAACHAMRCAAAQKRLPARYTREARYTSQVWQPKPIDTREAERRVAGS